MKELVAHCTLYLKVEDDLDLLDAMDTLFLNIDPDVAMYINESHFQNENGEVCE